MMNAISQGTQNFRPLAGKPAAAQESAHEVSDQVMLGSDASLSSGDGIGNPMAWRTYSSGSGWATRSEASIGWRSQTETTNEYGSEKIVDDRGTLQYYDMFERGTSSGSTRNGIVWRDKNKWANQFERGATYIPG